VTRPPLAAAATISLSAMEGGPAAHAPVLLGVGVGATGFASAAPEAPAAPEAAAATPLVTPATALHQNHIRLYCDRDKLDGAQFQLRRKDGHGELTEVARSNMLIELALAKGDHDEEAGVCQHYGVHRNTGREWLKRWRQRATVSTAPRTGLTVKRQRSAAAAATAAAPPIFDPSGLQQNHIRLYVDRDKPGAKQFPLRHNNADGKRGELTEAARLNLLVELALAAGNHKEENRICQHYGVHRNTRRDMLKRWRQRASVTTAPRSGRPAVKRPRPSPTESAPGAPTIIDPNGLKQNHIRLYADRDKTDAAQFPLYRVDGGSDAKSVELTEAARSNLLVELALATGNHDEEAGVCRQYGILRNTGRDMLKNWRQNPDV
jgi:transposase